MEGNLIYELPPLPSMPPMNIDEKSPYDKMMSSQQLTEDAQKNIYEKMAPQQFIEDTQTFEPALTTRKLTKQATQKKRFVALTVLLQCLMLMLLVVILVLLMLTYMSTRKSNDNRSTSTIAGSASTGSLNFTEWSDGIVHKVNANVTGSFLNFTDVIAQSTLQRYPNFTEWSNGIVYKVNTKVVGSFPNFTEWLDILAQNTLNLIQNNDYSINFTVANEQLQIAKESAQKLIGIVNTLSNLQDTSTSTAGVVDDILLVIQELLVLHNDSTALPTSCKEIKRRQPNSPSGVYLLAKANGGATYTTYCNMEELCGSGGGWTRLAHLDMTDSTEKCPSGFRLYQSGGVRACGRPVTSNGSCESVQFPSNGISYSQVCGRVVGYQFGSTDAIHTGFGSNHSNINGDYVDGVSITRGSPRQHVWTLMAAHSEAMNPSHSNPSALCPCNNDSTTEVQSFIDDDYFCESGNIYNFAAEPRILYISDPLWDGQECCSSEELCCTAPGLPWFHRDYGNTTTTDYLELRVCADQGTDDEDVPVSFYEIYVQ